MDAQEMKAKLEAMEELKGLEITAYDKVQRVSVYGFGYTADYKLTKSILEGLGFHCTPNSGDWQGEREGKYAMPQVSEEARKAAIAAQIEAGRTTLEHRVYGK